MMNLAVGLTDSASRYPDKEAVVMGSVRLTYAQLDAISNQIANGLAAGGVKKGDKVAICCPNLPYFPMVYYGILKAGAAVVPLNVLLKKREIAYHLEDSDSVALFCFEGTPELPLAQAAHDAVQEVDACKNLWFLPAQPGGPSPVAGGKTLNDLVADQSPEFQAVQMDANDTAVVLYTSGTTGKPKGAELTHSNMIMNPLAFRTCIEITPDDRVLCVLPMFHSYGQSTQMNAGLMAGATLVLLPRFSPEAVLQLMQDEDITLWSGVPTMYWDILNYPDADKFDLKKISNTLRMCGSGGAAIPVEVMKAFEKTFDVMILEGYGLSETSPVACSNRPDVARKPGSIGLPIWGVEMRCVDENMNDVKPGEPGEVVIRGHNIMKGYYKRPEATEEAFKGGWFHSGDVAKRDEDGYFYIVDRTKDMIIRGGFNVYPREIEEVLVTHEHVSLAAVIGIPDDEYGEEVVAFIIPAAGANVEAHTIKAWAKENMAAYKYPRIVEIVEEFPLGPSGKILKRELREKFEARAKETAAK
jgi:long-chain acyl-CoA synthetase